MEPNCQDPLEQRSDQWLEENGQEGKGVKQRRDGEIKPGKGSGKWRSYGADLEIHNMWKSNISTQLLLCNQNFSLRFCFTDLLSIYGHLR